MSGRKKQVENVYEQKERGERRTKEDVFGGREIIWKKKEGKGEWRIRKVRKVESCSFGKNTAAYFFPK